MKTTTLLTVTSVSLMIAGLIHSFSNNPETQRAAQLIPTQAVQTSGDCPWFKSAPRMQIVDESPQVTDVREVPEAPQYIELPAGVQSSPTAEPVTISSQPGRVQSYRPLSRYGKGHSEPASLQITGMIVGQYASPHRSIQDPQVALGRKLLGRITMNDDSQHNF